MSIHVCKCNHCAKDEYHLRYPGLSQEQAQSIANKINRGDLDRMNIADEVARLFHRYETLKILFGSLVASISHEANAKASIGELRITMQPVFREAISNGMPELDALLIPPMYPPNAKITGPGEKP